MWQAGKPFPSLKPDKTASTGRPVCPSGSASLTGHPSGQTGEKREGR